MPIGSQLKTQQSRKQDWPRPFPEGHAPQVTEKQLAMRGRVLRGILQKPANQMSITLSTDGLFQIRTAIIDNPTSQWLWVQEAFRFVPPRVIGCVLVLEGNGQLTIQYLSPTGINQPNYSGPDPDAVRITAVENRWPSQPGVLLLSTDI